MVILWQDIDKLKIDELAKVALFHFRTAAEMVYRHDYYLIFNGNDLGEYVNSNRSNISAGSHVGERAIVFRLAHYYQNILDVDVRFGGYVVDCEYNRNMSQPKGTGDKNETPDIILHQRGSNSHNILVVEAKTYWNNSAYGDMNKLRDFAKEPYYYRVGLSIIYGVTRDNFIVKAVIGDKEYDIVDCFSEQ